jgi:hypothetical protein
MSEQTKPASEQDDKTKTTGSRSTELTNEDLDQVGGGFQPIDGKPYTPIDG